MLMSPYSTHDVHLDFLQALFRKRSLDYRDLVRIIELVTILGWLLPRHGTIKTRTSCCNKTIVKYIHIFVTLHFASMQVVQEY